MITGRARRGAHRRIGPAAARKAAGGEEAQVHRENRDQQDADPEDRDGDAELGDGGDSGAIPAVGLDGGENAQRHGDEHGEDEGEQRQRDGDGQAGADFLADRQRG